MSLDSERQVDGLFRCRLRGFVTTGSALLSGFLSANHHVIHHATPSRLALSRGPQEPLNQPKAVASQYMNRIEAQQLSNAVDTRLSMPICIVLPLYLYRLVR